LTKEQCTILWEFVHARLSREQQALVSHIGNGFRFNSQVTVHLKPSVASHEIWALAKSINEVGRGNNLPSFLPVGKTFFAAVDKPDWQKSRDRMMRAAVEVMTKLAPPQSSKEVAFDWPSGTVWLTKAVNNDDLFLGSVKRQVWSWGPEALELLGINLDTAQKALSEIVSS